MSKLRLRLLRMASNYTVDPNTGYHVFEDGTVVDPESGEIMEQQNSEQPAEQPAAPADGNQSEDSEFKKKLKNVMYEEAPKGAKSDYPDSKYDNKWGKVSALNIIFIEDMNSIYGMTPEQAKTFVINKIKELNQKYGNDKSYDYVSQTYLNGMAAKMSSMKTIDKVVQYLTDAYFKGVGMGMTPNKKSSGLLIDLNNKEALKALLPVLTKMANKE